MFWRLRPGGWGGKKKPEKRRKNGKNGVKMAKKA